MTRKSALCAQSAAVVAHLKQHGAATLAYLMHHFPADGRSKLRKRLSSLYDGNWLDIAWTPDGEMLWLVAPRARAAQPALPQPVNNPPVLVPPRRINVMVGNYTPPPMAPARPGALDYQRYASQGVRC